MYHFNTPIVCTCEFTLYKVLIKNSFGHGIELISVLQYIHIYNVQIPIITIQDFTFSKKCSKQYFHAPCWYMYIYCDVKWVRGHLNNSWVFFLNSCILFRYFEWINKSELKKKKTITKQKFKRSPSPWSSPQRLILYSLKLFIWRILLLELNVSAVYTWFH